HGSANLYLDRFRCRLTNAEVVFAANVGDDRLVQFQAANSSTFGADDVVHREHCCFGDATADIDDHISGRRADGKPCANGGCQRFPDQERFTCASLQRCFVDGAFFHTGHAVGDRNHDGGFEEADAPRDLAEEVAQHCLSDFVIGNHAVLQRANHLNVFVVYSSEHFTGRLPDFDDAFVFNGEGDQCWLLQNDLFIFINQDVDRSKVNAQPFVKHSHWRWLPDFSDYQAGDYTTSGGRGR